MNFNKKKYFLSFSFMYFIMLLTVSLISLMFSINLIFLDKVIYIEWLILEMNSVSIIMILLLDWMSMSFIGVVTLISSMVMLYSYGYMGSDSSLSRFIVLVYLFVVSMMLLILSPNMISILLGWDGLGLVSYCLVIYYQNSKSSSAGLLTVLSNRIGDVAILLSISWMFNFGSWNIYYLAFMYNYHVLFVILILVVLAAMTKSAQIPFSAWLPAAMAAPTPVSSLVHSSTLVTAGVYLLIRFNELLGINNFLLLISIITMFMSGVGANFETDLKKIIALSTLSQLGVMMMILSLGFSDLAYFHLITHALFKSLLFLCAGAYIHSVEDAQDIRLISGASKNMPLTSIYFVGCSFSLCGFPYLAGFYSKDLIIETFFMGEMNSLLFILLVLGTMMTVTYSMRLAYYCYFKNLGLLNKFYILNEDKNMLLPMSVLFVVSVFIGSFFSWSYSPVFSIILPFLIKILVLSMIIIFIMMVLNLLNQTLKASLINTSSLKLTYFLGTMWGLPIISTFLFMPYIFMGSKYLKYLDMGWFEYYGGQKLFSNLLGNSTVMEYWNNLGIKSYLLLLFMVLVTLLIF